MEKDFFITIIIDLISTILFYILVPIIIYLSENE